MDAFKRHQGKIAILNQDNVDTDRIMPARFLTRIERSGYGELLFHDVRGNGFVLDQPEANGATILIVGTNFGCGSSREHAVWGLQQAGFRAIIARIEAGSPGFSDIFRQNSANCGLLLIELPSESHLKLTKLQTGDSINIDLEKQIITTSKEEIHFEVNEINKENLLEGRDLIGTTLSHENSIRTYEAKDQIFAPKLLVEI